MSKFDKQGRMKYNPAIHTNHKKPWSQNDVQYVIDYYYKDGPTELSFALGRTLATVETKASVLRRSGLLNRPKMLKLHKRFSA